MTLILAGVLSALPAQSQTSISELDSLWAVGARDTAFVLLAPAIDHARETADTTSLVVFLTRAAGWRKAIGEPADGEPFAREALALAYATGDSSLACAPHRWLGVVLTALGRNEDAKQQYERLLELATNVDDGEHQGWANIGLGWDADINRQSQLSHDRYAAAAEHFHRIGDAEGELWGHLGKANARFHMGQYEAAAKAWDDVVVAAQQAGFSRHETLTINNIAALQFALGRPDVSMGYYKRAIAAWDSLGNAYDRIPPALNLGSCLALLGREDEARTLFNGLLEDCREGQYRDYEARTLRRLAKLDRQQGDMESSLAHFKAILDLGDELPVLEHIEALRGQATLLTEDGQHEDALLLLREAESRLTDDETSAHRSRLNLAIGDVLVKLDRLPEARIYLDRADKTLGAARARHGLDLSILRATYHEAVGQADSALVEFNLAADLWEQERGLPLDPDWREERGAAGRQIFTRLAGLMATQQGVDAAFDRLQIYKARTLRERRWGPGHRSEDAAADTTASVTLAQLQTGILHENELFLDTYLGPRQSLMFAVTRDTCVLAVLPSDADLAPSLRQLHAELSDPQVEVVMDSVAVMLLRPLKALVTSQTQFILAPDGACNLVPLSVLFPSNMSLNCARIPSATMLGDLRRANSHLTDDQPLNVLAVTGSHDDATALPAAAWESKYLAKHYDHVTRLQITSPNQLGPDSDLLSADVLHLAVHSRGDDHNAWQSAIVFNDSVADLQLRALEIAERPLSARLAVLASCGSASGRVVSGEGVQGLSSAFLAAGVPSVLATLWPVDDDGTAFFMTEFYARLARGDNVATALRLAQGACRRDPVFGDPAYWSAFVLIGDGEQVIQLKAATQSKRGVVYSLLAVVLIAGLILVLRRR